MLGELCNEQWITELLKNFHPIHSQVCTELNLVEFFNEIQRKSAYQGTISCKQSIP